MSARRVKPDSEGVSEKWHGEGQREAESREAPLIGAEEIKGTVSLLKKCLRMWEGALRGLGPSAHQKAGRSRKTEGKRRSTRADELWLSASCWGSEGGRGGEPCYVWFLKLDLGNEHTQFARLSLWLTYSGTSPTHRTSKEDSFKFWFKYFTGAPNFWSLIIQSSL